MEFSIKNGNPEKQRHECLIVGVFEDRKLTDAVKSLDDASNKAISTILKTGDLEGKLGATLLLHALPAVAATRVLLVGLGKQTEFGEKQYRQAVRAAIKALPKGVTNAAIFLAELTIKKSDIHAKVAQLVEVAMDATYQVNAIKQKKAEPLPLEKMAIFVEKTDEKQAEAGLKHGLAIAAGVTLAKDLGNLPPNICTPTYLGKQAKALAKIYGFKVEVLEKDEIEKLGMGSFLGVAQGSVEPPRFIVLQHL